MYVRAAAVAALIFLPGSVFGQPVAPLPPPTPRIVEGDLSVFGLTLGQPVSVPHCSEHREDVSRLFGPKQYRIYVTMPPGAEMCYGKTDSLFGVWAKNFDVNGLISSKPFPDFVEASMLEVALNGPILEGIRISTNHALPPEGILAALSGKYGEPTMLSVEELSNAYGARLNVIYASWRFSTGAELRFNSGTSLTGPGSITAKSSEFVRGDEALEKAEHDREVKF